MQLTGLVDSISISTFDSDCLPGNDEDFATQTAANFLGALRSHLIKLPGGGAEIFNERVRRIICDQKIDGQEWLETARAAHELGLHSNCTMLYGHVENEEDRVDHLVKLRELQDETNGFVTFIPLAFPPKIPLSITCLKPPDSTT